MGYKKDVIELTALSDRVQALKLEMAQLKQAMCSLYCPVKIGDTIKVTGFSHKGKDMVVSHITYHQKRGFSPAKFQVQGVIKCKDGSLSKSQLGEVAILAPEE